MRTTQQFSGSAWLSYDRAFCRQATAYKLTDLSHLNPELFHFYVSGCISVKHPTVAPPVQSVSPTKMSGPADFIETSGTPLSSTLCHSWNAGRCLGEVSRKIWLHDFAINSNGRSVPVIFISLDFHGCSALHRPVVAHQKAANSPAPEPPFKRRQSSDV